MSNPELHSPELARSIEAILMVVDEPVTELTLATVLEVPVEQIISALEALVPSYSDRGFALKAINGGWRFYSHPDFSPAVEKFVLDGQQNRLTQAASGNPGRDCLSTAGFARSSLCYPGSQRRGSDEDPDHSWPGGGVRGRERNWSDSL